MGPVECGAIHRVKSAIGGTLGTYLLRSRGVGIAIRGIRFANPLRQHPHPRLIRVAADDEQRAVITLARNNVSGSAEDWYIINALGIFKALPGRT